MINMSFFQGCAFLFNIICDRFFLEKMIFLVYDKPFIGEICFFTKKIVLALRLSVVYSFGRRVYYMT